MSIAAPEADAELVALDAALETLRSASPRAHQVVELRFFAGLSLEETAATLALSTKTVQRDWLAARAWLRAEIGPRGEPGPCAPELSCAAGAIPWPSLRSRSEIAAENLLEFCDELGTPCRPARSGAQSDRAVCGLVAIASQPGPPVRDRPRERPLGRERTVGSQTAVRTALDQG